jgi:hypothetical protein
MNRHMNEQHSKDSDFKRWLSMYNNQNSKKKYVITKDMLILIKYFITSHAALSQLSIPFFLSILERAKYKAPSDRTFKKVLDDALEKVRAKIQEKLDEALSICLITDIWTNKNNEDFIAVSAALNSEGFVREVITIGMMTMDGSHCAENIQVNVEKIVNCFKFNKANVHGIVSDEGSALVRLFKQITNDDLDDLDLTSLAEEEKQLLGVVVDEFVDSSSNDAEITNIHDEPSYVCIPAKSVIDEEIRNTLGLVDKLTLLKKLVRNLVRLSYLMIILSKNLRMMMRKMNMKKTFIRTEQLLKI